MNASPRHAAADRPIALLGGGGHALVIAEAAHAAGLPLAGVYDDREPDLSAFPEPHARLGTLGDAVDSTAGDRAHALMLAIGDLPRRRGLIDALADAPTDAPSSAQVASAKTRFALVVHPSATLSPTCALKPGAFAAAGVVVNGRAQIGAHAILNTRCVVEHDCIVGPNAHVAPGAIMCGGSRLGADALLGAGATVLPGVRIGDGCTVGAGAVVSRDLADGVVAAGVPARVVG
jgi:sugar O-acyltransferase (sialic acid O-acetyltransferase NeuD family)